MLLCREATGSIDSGLERVEFSVFSMVVGKIWGPAGVK